MKIIIYILAFLPLTSLASSFQCNEVEWNSEKILIHNKSKKAVSGVVQCATSDFSKEGYFLDGKNHGRSRTWVNGKLVKDISYNFGVKEGAFYQRNESVTRYSSSTINGNTTKSVMTYSSDTYGMYKLGKKHGKWVEIKEFANADYRVDVVVYDKGVLIKTIYPDQGKVENIF